MRIGFTGTQSGMTNFQKAMLANILKEEGCTEFIHGDCVGADSQANDIAIDCGIKYITIFPPDNPNKRAWKFDATKNPILHKWEWQEAIIGIKVRWAPRAPYLDRNKHIVDNCEMMIACPKEAEHTVRSGTWATIRYAWKVKRKIVIIPPIQRND